MSHSKNHSRLVPLLNGHSYDVCSDRHYDSFDQQAMNNCLLYTELKSSSAWEQISTENNYGYWCYAEGENFEALEKYELQYFEAFSIDEFLLELLDFDANFYEILKKDGKNEFVFRQSYKDEDLPDLHFIFRPMTHKEIKTFKVL